MEVSDHDMKILNQVFETIEAEDLRVMSEQNNYENSIYKILKKNYDHEKDKLNRMFEQGEPSEDLLDVCFDDVQRLTFLAEESNLYNERNWELNKKADLATRVFKRLCPWDEELNELVERGLYFKEMQCMDDEIDYDAFNLEKGEELQMVLSDGSVVPYPVAEGTEDEDFEEVKKAVSRASQESDLECEEYQLREAVHQLERIPITDRMLRRKELAANEDTDRMIRYLREAEIPVNYEMLDGLGDFAEDVAVYVGNEPYDIGRAEWLCNRFERSEYRFEVAKELREMQNA